MRRFLLFLLISLTLTACTHLSTTGSDRANPRSMAFAPLSFDIPKAERVVLNCGMPVYLLRDTELPIVSLTAMVHTGSVYDPPDKPGLAGITGAVMRSGGAGGIAPEAMDDQLEFMASSVESSISGDMGVVSCSTLTKNLSPTLKLFSQVLLQPDFAEKRLEIARNQTLEGLRRQNDDPKAIADRELLRAIYAGHPLGNLPTVESVRAITRQDLIRFHQQFYRTDNMILAVSGDFDKAELLAQLNDLFPSPPVGGSPVRPVSSPLPDEVTAEVLYAKKEVSQSVIRLGHLGISKESPDIYAIRLLDYILGGSFTSRLTLEIRTNRGLAYNVGSHFDIGRIYPGTFTAETETKAESTGTVIELMTGIITGMAMKPVTDQELQAAKDYMLNSFLFGFTSAASVVTQRARLEYYGYPPNYLETYRDRIAQVTKEELLAAARRHLKYDAFKIVVVGNSAKFDRPLENFGPVRELTLSNSGK